GRKARSGEGVGGGGGGRARRRRLIAERVMAGPDGQVPDAAETEASLLARAQAGDVAAFERLSGAYADRLFMLLYRLLGDRAEAEGVAPEVMLRARRGLPRVPGQSRHLTLLYPVP